MTDDDIDGVVCERSADSDVQGVPSASMERAKIVSSENQTPLDVSSARGDEAPRTEAVQEADTAAVEETLPMPAFVHEFSSRLAPCASGLAHHHRVACLAVAPSGQFCVSGGWDRSVRVWNLEASFELAWNLQSHRAAVSCVSIAPDSTHLVTGSSDTSLIVWSAQEGRQVATLTGHTNRVTAVCYSADGINVVSTAWDGTVRVWDLQLRMCVHVCRNHKSTGVSLVVTPRLGSLIYSIGWDSKVLGWNASGVIQTVRAPPYRVMCAATTHDDDSLLFIGSRDCLVTVWDMSQGVQVGTLRGLDNWVAALALPQGPTSHVVAASCTGDVCIWSFPQGTLLSQFHVAQQDVCSIALVPSLPLLICGSTSGSVVLWNLENIVPASPIPPIGDRTAVPIKTLGFRETPKYARLLSANGSGSGEYSNKPSDNNAGSDYEEDLERALAASLETPTAPSIYGKGKKRTTSAAARAAAATAAAEEQKRSLRHEDIVPYLKEWYEDDPLLPQAAAVLSARRLAIKKAQEARVELIARGGLTAPITAPSAAVPGVLSMSDEERRLQTWDSNNPFPSEGDEILRHSAILSQHIRNMRDRVDREFVSLESDITSDPFVSLISITRRFLMRFADRPRIEYVADAISVELGCGKIILHEMFLVLEPLGVIQWVRNRHYRYLGANHFEKLLRRLKTQTVRKGLVARVEVFLQTESAQPSARKQLDQFDVDQTGLVLEIVRVLMATTGLSNGRKEEGISMSELQRFLCLESPHVLLLPTLQVLTGLRWVTRRLPPLKAQRPVTMLSEDGTEDSIVAEPKGVHCEDGVEETAECRFVWTGLDPEVDRLMKDGLAELVEIEKMEEMAQRLKLARNQLISAIRSETRNANRVAAVEVSVTRGKKREVGRKEGNSDDDDDDDDALLRERAKRPKREEDEEEEEEDEDEDKEEEGEEDDEDDNESVPDALAEMERDAVLANQFAGVNEERRGYGTRLTGGARVVSLVEMKPKTAEKVWKAKKSRLQKRLPDIPWFL